MNWSPHPLWYQTGIGRSLWYRRNDLYILAKWCTCLYKSLQVIEDSYQCCINPVKVLLKLHNLPTNPDCVVLRICISLRPPHTFGSSKENRQNSRHQEIHHKIILTVIQIRSLSPRLGDRLLFWSRGWIIILSSLQNSKTNETLSPC